MNPNPSSLDLKCYVYQMIRGLLYLHSKGICHRDLKPQNMLIKQRRLVLCDFGSAKILKPGEQNISYICSRCYRAPELIFEATNYTTQIDMWSLGCILLEILNGRPLFIADSSLNHILEVIKVLGTPSKDDVRCMNPQYEINDYDLPQIKRKSFKAVRITPFSSFPARTLSSSISQKNWFDTPPTSDCLLPRLSRTHISTTCGTRSGSGRVGSARDSTTSSGSNGKNYLFCCGTSWCPSGGSQLTEFHLIFIDIPLCLIASLAHCLIALLPHWHTRGV